MEYTILWSGSETCFAPYIRECAGMPTTLQVMIAAIISKKGVVTQLRATNDHRKGNAAHVPRT